MPGHIFLFVLHASITLVVGALDMLICRKIIKHDADSFYFYLAMGQDAAGMVYVLAGLLYAMCTVQHRMTLRDQTVANIFYVIAGVLGVTEGIVVVGIEQIIWRQPGEFIDLTWLFELITLGYQIGKWVVLLSYAVALADIHITPVL